MKDEAKDEAAGIPALCKKSMDNDAAIAARLSTPVPAVKAEDMDNDGDSDSDMEQQ